MILSFDERLNQILPRVTSRDFLDSKGLGNEIGFWIFDYPPDRELDMRSFLPNLDLLILTGVGSVYPMLRTHTLLSALHPIMGNTPLLMFFPGRYDGHSLRLFNSLAEDHYYRAFRLVPETT
jgi:hypothetical protein